MSRRGEARTVGPASWPAPRDARDPFAALLRPIAGAGPLVASLREVLAGRASIEEAEAHAGRLGIRVGFDPDPAPGPPVRAAAIPSEEDLVRIAADCEPDAVPASTDPILGPYAEWCDPRAVLVATAWGALLPGESGDVPLSRWVGRPGGPDRAGSRALLRAPPAPWQILAIEGGAPELRLTVADPLGRAGRAAPGAPVVLRGPCAAPAGPLCEGGGLFARLIPTLDRGTLAVLPLAVPALPGRLGLWLRALALVARAEGRAVATAGEVLRLRGADLARWTLEAAFLTEARS